MDRFGDRRWANHSDRIRSGGFGARLTPQPGTQTEAALKARVEQAEVVKATLGGDVNDLCFRIAQQGNGLEQAHLHAQSGDRDPDMAMKQAIQMTAAAAELSSQFSD